MAKDGADICLIGLTRGKNQTAREDFPSGGRLVVRRIHAEPVDKSNYAARLLWTVRTDLRLIREYRRARPRKGSELVITGSPPFMLFFALPAKILRGARLRYRITDFYPEVLIANSGASATLTLFKTLTWWMRRKVDCFEALGFDQRNLLIQGGVDPLKIVVKRDPSPVAITGMETPMTLPSELSGRKILLYSGNFGVAHEVDTVLEGYKRHHRQGTGKFGLWLNATGENADIIERRLREERLPYARTRPGLLEELPHLLAAADAHLITLRDAFAGIVLPSKVYACLASKKPIVFVGPTASDVHLLCEESQNGAYEHVRCGDPGAFANALERLAGEMIPKNDLERDLPP